jgi:hypothetical protein
MGWSFKRGNIWYAHVKHATSMHLTSLHITRVHASAHCSMQVQNPQKLQDPGTHTNKHMKNMIYKFLFFMPSV